MDKIIDLVQSSDGTYVSEDEVKKPRPKKDKRVIVEKEFHEHVDDFLDGVEEGKAFFNKVFKVLGV